MCCREEYSRSRGAVWFWLGADDLGGDAPRGSDSLGFLCALGPVGGILLL